MSGLLSTLIAVLGTLLGVAMTHLFQRRSAANDQLFATQQQLRSERMSVYSDFAGAVTEFRRGQQDRWHRKNEDPDSPARFEARVEAYRLRGIALHALFRVQLIASSHEVVSAARHAYTVTDQVHSAADKTELSAVGAQARDALEDFVKLAASDVR
ncbi:hypothetical protein [Streptomyces fuscichromogenes]|uniref:Uncharacterized protein n=1 Tax=Streptomyces fuscichromogenes TaxID=1324013 RepID=A0A918CWX0_9ACTN|nr:hypothetical protein [Streptomyces fuscichromogenes]GGN40159.1 hypothetical protein GCM10011578_087430 [Streptomyces fuscichromogenes]